MARFEIDASRLNDPGVWPERCARCFAPSALLVPVPPKSNGKLPEWSLPFCRRHENDWVQSRMRNRIGIALILGTFALIATLAWLLYPQFAAGNDNWGARFATSFFCTLGAVIPLGILLAFWAKMPIRVDGRNGRFVEVAGVCGDFAKAMAKVEKEAPLPDVPDEVAFEVVPYRPQSQSPFDTALIFIGVSLLVPACSGP